MTLENTIQNDLMLAMKNKESVKLTTLRAVKTCITEKKTSPGFSGELTDADVIKIMQKMVKEREEVSEVYNANGRKELADKEIEEANVIKGYLPIQMSDEEINTIVKEIAEEIGASSMKDMGKVMGAASKKLSGRADRRKISEAVKKLLS
jgi:uncharacterized protein